LGELVAAGVVDLPVVVAGVLGLRVVGDTGLRVVGVGVDHQHVAGDSGGADAREPVDVVVRDEVGDQAHIGFHGGTSGHQRDRRIGCGHRSAPASTATSTLRYELSQTVTLHFVGHSRVLGRLGWYIYFHHITPNDQRWFLEVGVSAVALAICAGSGFDPAVCTYGIGIAGILVITIDHYYTPSYCLEIQINYWISLHNEYRTRC